MIVPNGVIDSKYKKYIILLRKPAARAKIVLKDGIQKTQKRFLDQADKLETGDEKNRVLKKLNKIAEDLQILENLSEDDIIEFALTTTKKIMAVASNPRLPKELRMKARVSSHKPLSSHLARVRRLVEAGSDQSESEEESEAADNADGKLDRVTMNNEIVKMRGNIKRAKVHLIHKFTRSVKLLQKSKGKEERKAKCERKAERFVKKIKHIKEVEADDVSRFALSTKTEDVEKLLADVKIPMKSQAMALITLHKFVAASVKDFRTKYPEWNESVPSLLKKKKKKRKLNIETVSNVGPKFQKDSRSGSDTDGEGSDEEKENSDIGSDGRSDKSNSGSEEESASSGSEDEEGNNIRQSDSGEIRVINEDDNCENESDQSIDEDENNSEDETFENESDEVENDTKEETGNNFKSDSENDELLSSNEEFQNDSEASNTKFMVKKTSAKSLKRHLELPKIPRTINKKSKTTVISQKKPNVIIVKNKEDKESDKHSSSKKSLKPKVVKEKPKVVDPFFMTTTNEEYLTSQVPAVSDKNESSWKSKSSDFNQKRPDKFSNFNNRNKWSNREDNWKLNKFTNQKPFAEHSEKASFHNSTEPFNIFTNRKERRKALQQPPQELKVEKLHPSWEAKKKQTSIVSFQGKKITFD